MFVSGMSILAGSWPTLAIIYLRFFSSDFETSGKETKVRLRWSWRKPACHSSEEAEKVEQLRTFSCAAGSDADNCHFPRIPLRISATPVAPQTRLRLDRLLLCRVLACNSRPQHTYWRAYIGLLQQRRRPYIDSISNNEPCDDTTRPNLTSTTMSDEVDGKAWDIWFFVHDLRCEEGRAM